MTSIELQQKAFEIAELLFKSEGMVISLNELTNHLGGEFEEFSDLVREALYSNKKIVPNKQGRIGGIKFAEEKYRRSSLSQIEKSALAKKVDDLWNEYQLQSKKASREKPEKEVEKAFQNWLATTDNKLFQKSVITSFRSEARRGAKWKNVDGYSIFLDTHKYHLSFKPILTTFEVKATLPKADGIGQAKHYLAFSHHVYLVFRFEKGADELKKEIKKPGHGFNELDGVGVIYTADGINFEILYESNPSSHPSEKSVDEHLELLLSEKDKEKLLEIKYKYLVEQVLIPAISL